MFTSTRNKQTPWDLWLSTNLQFHSVNSGFPHPTASHCGNLPIYAGSASWCVCLSKLDRPNYYNQDTSSVHKQPCFNMHLCLWYFSPTNIMRELIYSSNGCGSWVVITFSDLYIYVYICIWPYVNCNIFIFLLLWRYTTFYAKAKCSSMLEKQQTLQEL